MNNTNSAEQALFFCAGLKEMADFLPVDWSGNQQTNLTQPRLAVFP
jgi:hypothetical protein